MKQCQCNYCVTVGRKTWRADAVIEWDGKVNTTPPSYYEREIGRQTAKVLTDMLKYPSPF